MPLDQRVSAILSRWDHERSAAEIVGLGPAALALLLDAGGSLHRPGDDPRDFEDALHAAVAAFGAQDLDGVLARMRKRKWSTARALRSGVGRVADPRVVSMLLEEVAGGDAFDRCRAVEDLGAQSDPRATRALVRALSDRSSQVRAAAIRSLGDPAAIPALQAFARRVQSSKSNGWMAGEARAAVARIRKQGR